MPPRRRKFIRLLGERRYRKLFIIATEGAKTEPQYFAIFNNGQSVIRVSCIKSHQGSSPLQVLKRMKEHIKNEGLKKSDEAWLVVDRDQWNDVQLNELFQWSREAENYGFALSNPKFEYWLLLHFEDGNEITSSNNCSQRLAQHLPNYDKGIDSRKFTNERIVQAILRAKHRDNPACIDWPRTCGCTTVYKLVENIREST